MEEQYEESSRDQCGICYDRFDSKNRQPRMFPCGHTVCLQCIKNMIQHEEITCPFDKIVYDLSANGIDSLPKNFQIYSQLQSLKDLKLQMCKEHKREKLSLYCLNCSMFICSECHINEHLNHKLQKAQEAQLIELKTKTKLAQQQFQSYMSVTSQEIGDLQEHVSRLSKFFAPMIKYSDLLISNINNIRNYFNDDLRSKENKLKCKKKIYPQLEKGTAYVNKLIEDIEKKPDKLNCSKEMDYIQKILNISKENPQQSKSSLLPEIKSFEDLFNIVHECFDYYKQVLYSFQQQFAVLRLNQLKSRYYELNKLDPQKQRQIISEAIYHIVQRYCTKKANASKIFDMLVSVEDMSIEEILANMENPKILQQKILEAEELINKKLNEFLKEALLKKIKQMDPQKQRQFHFEIQHPFTEKQCYNKSHALGITSMLIDFHRIDPCQHEKSRSSLIKDF